MSENKSGKIIKDQSSLGQFSSAIAQICEEKGIDKDRVINSIEAALAAAYKKDYGKKGQIIIAHMNEDTSETNFKQLKEVVDKTTRMIEEEYIPEEIHQVSKNAVKSEEKIERHTNERFDHKDEDGEISLPKFNSERDVLLVDTQKVVKDIELGNYIEYPLEIQDQYGRIASQTAKQVIIQKIREAEREAMYEEFKGREGEIINGTVQRIEAGKVFIDLGKSTGVLFQSEQIPGENYRIGQRLKLYIDKVDSDPRSLGIGLSRKHPQLLAKLFELEVPEIFAGTVEIKAVAREAGMRSKIAVVSHEEGIDPVGSCVGQKGTRVQAIIDELNGEKIDIIEWVDNAEEMIAQALSPAKVAKVELVEDIEDNDKVKDEKEVLKESSNYDKEKDGIKKEDDIGEAVDSVYKKAIAYVMDDQLSLAIGKRGQNVRLAAKLTGWNINVESLNPEEAEIESEDEKNDEKTKEIEESKKSQVKDDGESRSEEVLEDEKIETKSKKSIKKVKDKNEENSKKETKKVLGEEDKKAKKKIKKV